MTNYPYLLFGKFQVGEAEQRTVLGWLQSVRPEATTLNGHGNYVDAMRHGGVAAILGYRLGYSFTIKLGDTVEDYAPGPTAESKQDYYNNELGARLGFAARILGYNQRELGDLVKRVFRNEQFRLYASKSQSRQNISLGGGVYLTPDGVIRLRGGSKVLLSDSRLADLSGGMSGTDTIYLKIIKPNGVIDQLVLDKSIQLELKKQVFGQDARLENYCFVAGTLIDMWPTDPAIRPDAAGLYDKAEVLGKVWKKPIEQITPADRVVSFDDAGNLRPGRVARTFTNEAKVILDFFGTGVTPGHVYYRADSRKPHKFEPLLDILRDDGVIQNADGRLIRAATGSEVGSEDDRELWAFLVYTDEAGNERVRDRKKLRLGTRWMLPDGQHFSMREYMQGIGVELQPNGYVRWKGTGLLTPFVWTLSDMLPNPEDFVLARSGTTLEDIYKAAEWEGLHPNMPPPMMRDGGPVQPLSQAGLTLMPRNTPLAMRGEGYPASHEPSANRKQRKAAQAKERLQAKGKKRLVH